LIKVHLNELMKKKKKSTAQIVENSNYEIHRNTISNLKNGKVSGVQFDHLNILCRELGCNVQDIIEYVED